jgi:hypothetical protein
MFHKYVIKRFVFTSALFYGVDLALPQEFETHVIRTHHSRYLLSYRHLSRTRLMITEHQAKRSAILKLANTHAFLFMFDFILYAF